MGKKQSMACKYIAPLCLSVLICLFAVEARAVDILEVRIKRLYKDAQVLAEKGDYDGAIEIYNKAILMAKDKDIKQYLINAKKELQKKKRTERGDFRIFRVEEKPEEMVFEPLPEITPPAPEAEIPEAKAASEEKARLEEEKAKLEADKRQLEAERVKFEKARLEEEKLKLEADKAKFEEEKSKAEKPSFEEERRRAEEERQKALRAFEETPEKVMHEEAPAQVEPAVIEQKLPEEAEELDTDLEARKEREARDRAIYESSSYRLRVKEILNNVSKKMKEASVKAEEEEEYARVEPKIKRLTTLDRQAEEFISKGEYEKAKGIYEEILTMSKDPDLKEYIKKQKETAR